MDCYCFCLSTLIHKFTLRCLRRVRSNAQEAGEGGAASCGNTRAAGSTSSCTYKARKYPSGVSKTTSGKFQARIKLNGKRYNLGSDFATAEEAANAYAVAKRAGVTARPSPLATRKQRGTGALSRAYFPAQSC